MHTASIPPSAIGVIGIQQDKLRISDFQTTTLPVYKKEILTGVTLTDFNQSTYKAYLKVSKNNTQKITYVDSVDLKPQFIKLEIVDQISVIEELNKEANSQVLKYIENQKSAQIVTAVSLALPKSVVKEIAEAEAVFLVNNKYKQYELSLVRDNKSYKTINFAAATIFGYQLSNFCWGKNDKRRITLFDIVTEASACPDKTNKNANKIKEKVNYLKL